MHPIPRGPERSDVGHANLYIHQYHELDILQELPYAPMMGSLLAGPAFSLVHVALRFQKLTRFQRVGL